MKICSLTGICEHNAQRYAHPGLPALPARHDRPPHDGGRNWPRWCAPAPPADSIRQLGRARAPARAPLFCNHAPQGRFGHCGSLTRSCFRPRDGFLGRGGRFRGIGRPPARSPCPYPNFFPRKRSPLPRCVIWLAVNARILTDWSTDFHLRSRCITCMRVCPPR